MYQIPLIPVLCGAGIASGVICLAISGRQIWKQSTNKKRDMSIMAVTSLAGGIAGHVIARKILTGAFASI